MGWRRVGSIGRVAACLLPLILLGIPRLAVAQGSDLDAIRAATRDAHAQWFPVDNPVWRLTPEARSGLIGAFLPTRVNPSIGTFRAPARGVLPPRIDWRDINGASYVTGIRNQSGCSGCWAFASTATFESAFLIQQQTPNLEFDRSEQDVLSCSRGGDCRGGWVDEAMAYLAGNGVVDEACFPFAAKSLPCEDKCRDWDRRTFRARGIEAVPNDVDALRAALQDGPTTTCMTVYEDFVGYGGGVYQHVWGFVEGNHAVEVIGYDDAQQAFIAKNSYGEGWGEKGFFRIRYGDSEFGSCAYRIVRNRAPVIDWMPSVVLVPGAELVLPIPVVEPDGDPLTWDVRGLAALPGATLDATTATLLWTPLDGTVGTWDVTIRASDNWTPAGTAERTVRISACPAACDDGNPCTDDVCPDGICRHEFNVAPCVADGNSCTRDACVNGTCQAIEPDGTACDEDWNDCTLDECRAGACFHEPLPAGTSCGDDGSECTTDVCREGACVHDPLPEGTLCSSDFESCTVDACRGGACLHDPLPDGQSCGLGSDDPCTVTSCQTGVCNWTDAPDGTPCDDRRACTSGDTCVSGACDGTAPVTCDDGLVCTRDGCEDGASFGRSSALFEDIAGVGTDTGIDGDEAAAGPFDIGFGFPMGGGASRTQFWVSTNGVVSFGGPVSSGVHGDLATGPGPLDLVAVYWDDLECFRDAGCRATYLMLGAAPDRRLVIQWQGARLYGVPGSALAMQAVLHEDGGIDLRFGDLVAASGRTAAIGFLDASGRGVAYSVDHSMVGPGLSLRYDPAATYTCTILADEGICVIGGVCRSGGDQHPSDPCLACDDGASWLAWSPAPGGACDDGDPCTWGDTCQTGSCLGAAHDCASDDPCWTGVCDGGGQCRWTATVAPCDDGNACTMSDVCVNGMCAGAPLSEGSPCEDGRACTTGDRCTSGACVGAAPPTCDDGLDCTLKGCDDGPGFVPVDGPFEDISATGALVGTDSVQPTLVPVPLRFDFPFLGSIRTVAWPSPWGALRLTGTTDTPDDPGAAPSGLCPPDPRLPDGLVAAYWTDLYCDPAEGCQIRWQVLGTAPDRRLVVQWTRARQGGEAGTSLTFQVALFEGGAIELRYLKAVGMNGDRAAAGIQAGTGGFARGARLACTGAWTSAGKGYRYDPGRAWTCRFTPVEGACVVDGTCHADGDADPSNPCRVCRRGETAWAWSLAACDDGDPCTQGESCHLGDCRGTPNECRPTACQKTSICDGSGGCITEPRPAGSSCGAAWCDGDRFQDAPGCDGEGACVPGTMRECAPFGCRDGACLDACTGPKDCAIGARCVLAKGACQAPAQDGESCTADDDCLGGHCENGFCCPFGDCCASPLDCQATGSGDPSCADPATCQSTFRPAFCTQDGRCEAGDPVDDDSGCGNTVRQDCGWYRDHTCDGSADQAIFACPTTCAGDPDCDADALCESGACVPRDNDGATCAGDGDCGSGHCRN